VCWSVQVRRLREKLDVKQRAMCQRDEQLNSRNVELIFLAGQLVKVSHHHNSLVRDIHAVLTGRSVASTVADFV